MSLPAGSGSGGIGTGTVRVVVDYAFGTNPAATALDVTASNGNSPLTALPMDLASGDNTLSVPSAAAGVVFVPPNDNAVALTLKGDAGDTGIALAKTLPAVVTLNTPGSGTVIVNAGGSVTGCKLYWI